MLSERSAGQVVHHLWSSPMRLEGKLERMGQSTADGGNEDPGIHDDPVDEVEVTDFRAADSWFRQVLETAQEGIWMVDTAGRTIFANLRMAEILDRPIEELIGAAAFSFIPHDSQTDALIAFERNFTTNIRTPIDTHLRRSDGTDVAVRIVASPLLGDKGDVTGGLAFVADVSAQEQTRQELTLKEAWLDAIVQNAFDLVVAISEAGVITFATPITFEVLGLDESQVIGADPLSFVHPHDVHEAANAFGRAAIGSNLRDPFECRVRRGDGSYVWFEFTATDLIADSAINAVILHGRDVSERIEVSAQLARKEAWLGAILHQAFDAVVAVDADGLVTFATPTIESFLSRSMESFLGTKLADAVHPEDLPLASATFATVMKEPGASESVELRFLRSDGSPLWIEAKVTNLLLDPVVERIIINARDITDRHLADTKIAYHAMHDALTGLPNRYLLGDRLQHAMARREQRGNKLAVLFIDLDHFKTLNDSSGHSVGDSALREVAGRLRSMCRSGDTVARFGGDEFVLISENVSSLDEGRQVGERVLREVFDSPFDSGHGKVHLSASVGVALGDREVSADRLLADADTAMYRAKARGRGRVELFDPSMRGSRTSRLEAVETLRRAVDEGNLVVHYQPIVSLPDRHIVGAEALVRLHHPVLGLISPNDFIPLAEATGLINSIGPRVFELAFSVLHRIDAIAPDMPFSLSVNVSPVQLKSAEILDLPEIARRIGVDPHSIVLEISESIFLNEDELMSETIERLRGHGFRFAVDDFGTGHSSLSHLKRMAIDIVKIDRQFTAGLGISAEETAMVKAILAMAKALEVTVVAEGVETSRQASELTELRCPQAQGYLFSRPTPPSELESLIARQLRPA